MNWNGGKERLIGKVNALKVQFMYACMYGGKERLACKSSACKVESFHPVAALKCCKIESFTLLQNVL
jgi:hypothetical protein